MRMTTTSPLHHADVDHLQWHQLPVDGGQIVDVTYAADDGKLYCRSHDRNDGTVSITYQVVDDTADEDDLLFEPQNGLLPAVENEVFELQPDGEYEVEMESEGGGNKTVTIEADDLDEAIELAEEEIEEWVRGGDWGTTGARVSAWYTVDGERYSTTVTIEPDHDSLIKAAGGDTDCDHDWTSEGEGGCTENPGVWSTGGTSMVFKSHCRTCGLRKTEHHTGSQRNPGEHDTVEYEQPDSWCEDCQSEECTC